MLTYSKTGHIRQKTFMSQSSINEPIEPSSVNGALSNLNWKMAIDEEFQAYQQNNTWILTHPPPHQKNN